MDNVKQVADRIGIKFFKNDAFADVAEGRIRVCDTCYFRDGINCKLCNCSIDSKLYTPTSKACPKDYFKEVEDLYSDKLNKHNI